MRPLTMTANRCALAFAAALCLIVAGGAQAQTKKVRYLEVVRTLLYAPAYVAISKGYFKAAGLDVTMTTAWGGDKLAAAILSGAADIGLTGPEVPIYIRNSESPQKMKIFAGLVATDGFLLLSREKPAKFDWKMLKGKEILGWRPGSTPLLFFEEALRIHGLDPARDVKLSNNLAIPTRMGAWLSGQNQYAIFTEVEASQLEQQGKGYVVAAIGKEVGFADYTSFVATERYIRENPDVAQAFTDAIYKAMQWTATASTGELVKALAEFFPGVDMQALGAGAERYKTLGYWKKTPVIEPQAITKFQDILVRGKELDNAKRVKFEDLITNDFARKAK